MELERDKKITVGIIFIFALISLVSLKWFESGCYIHQIDSSFYLAPKKRLTDVLYMWKDQNSFGYSMAEFNLIPFYIWQVTTMEVVQKIGNTNYWKALIYTQRIIYYTTVFFSFVFSFLFFREFYTTYTESKENKKKNIVPFIASMFYVINPHTISVVFWRYMSWARFWFATPLLGYIYLKFLKTKRSSYILIGMLLFLTPISSGYSAVGFLLLYLLFLILTVSHILVYGKLLKTLKKAITYIIVFSLGLSWILIPQALSFHSTYDYAINLSSNTPQEMLRYSSRFTTIINIFRLIGNHLLYSTYPDGYPYPWIKEYLRNPASKFLLIYPLLILVPIFKVKSKKKIKLFLIVLSIWLAMVILMKGSSPPWGNIGYTLLKINSAFFRHPYDRFVSLYVMLYAILLMLSIDSLLDMSSQADSKKVYSLGLMLLVSILSVGYPFFTNEIIPKQDQLNLADTPYLSLHQYNFSEGNILIIPFSLYREYSYNISGRINHPNAKSIAYAFIKQGDNTIIRYASSESDKRILDYLYSSMLSNNTHEFLETLNMLQFRYILLQKDFSTKYLNQNFVNAAKRMMAFIKELDKERVISKVLDTGDFTIYKININKKQYIKFQVFPVLTLSNRITPYSLLVCNPRVYPCPIENLKLTNNIIYNENLEMNLIVSTANESVLLSPLSFNLYGWERNTYGIEKYIYAKYNYLNIPPKNLSTLFRDSALIMKLDFESPQEINKLTTSTKGYTISIMEDPDKQGHVLKVTTCRSTKGWSYISTPVVNVTPGEILLITLEMKFQNTKRTHVAVAGYDNITKRWMYISYVPPGMDGFSPWRKYTRIVQIPDNITKIKLVLNVGWAHNSTISKCSIVLFDNIKIYNITDTIKKPYATKTINIKETDTYIGFIRYLKNQKGGYIKVNMDNNTIHIQTYSPSNEFVWKDLGTFKLEEGEHKIVLENVRGFNAVNLFALVPENEYYKAREEIIKLLQNKTVIYIFEAESDLYNSNADTIKNLNASNGELIKFKDDGEAWQDMEIVKNSTYKIALKGIGTFNVFIGNYSYILSSENLTFRYTPTFYLREGKYKLKITPVSKDAILDVVWLYSTDNNETLEDIFNVNETPATVQNYTKINPTLWKVKVNATKPFFLTFAESYDPLWEARVYKDGKLVEKVKPVPVYGVINGFWINQTGDLEIVLRYTPQDWFERGLIISLTTFVLSIFYIFYDWRREKGDRWAGRLEEKFKRLAENVKSRIFRR